MSNVVPVERGFLETEHVQSWVFGHCGLMIGAYYCATCGISCPTRAHMADHVKSLSDVQHQVVFNCPKHGLEVPPAKSAKESETA